jgi:uncharacterized protein (TIGR02266 family)
MVREREDTKTMVERRRQPRHDIKLDVNYRHGDTYLYSRSSNISELGIFLVTGNPAPRGQRIELSFNVPGEEEPLQVHGEVRWIVHGSSGAEPGMGIRFIDPSDESRRRVKELIRTMAVLE